METKINWKKVRVILLVPIIMIAALIYTFSGGSEPGADGAEVRQSQEQAEVITEETAEETSSEPVYIYVDVGGAVAAPQVVCVEEGARVFQAIDKAGGKTENADLRNINLAQVCQDGEKIYVPTADEIANAIAPGPETGSSTPAAGGKININTASSEELQTLNGVGPGLAQRIIEYRETSGKFASVEDLKNVSGIGEKTFEKMKDMICV